MATTGMRTYVTSIHQYQTVVLHRLSVVLCSLLLIHSTLAQQTIRLGFLTPYPKEDSAIPVRLADEWISAIRISMEVLSEDYKDLFDVQPFVQNSDCDRTAGALAAKKLVNSGVVGIVGPACSEAAIGAAQFLATLDTPIPIISFAATATELGNRDRYPTFFRTVFPDTDQAKAIVNVTQFFNWTKIYMLYSDEAYGNGMQKDIIQAAVEYNVERTSMGSPLPPLDIVSMALPVDLPADGYKKYFASIVPTADVPVLLATTPRVTQNVWLDAFQQKKLDYPWWYFGTDGATAFDLIGQGDSYKSLAYNLQGEIGIYPYRGNFFPDSPYQRFLQTWSSQKYSSFPGLLTFPRYPQFTEPRAYVPYLIDAVWTFHWAFYKSINEGKQVNGSNVMGILSDPNFMFEGCTGVVGFKANSAERDTSRETAEFNFVSLSGSTWQNIGSWRQTDSPSLVISTDQISRPGKANEDAPAPTSSMTTENGTTITETATTPNTTEAELAADVKPAEASPVPPEYVGNSTVGQPMTNTVPAGQGQGQSNYSNHGPSAGVIAGIVVPLVLILVILAVAAAVYIKRRRQSDSEFVRVLF